MTLVRYVVSIIAAIVSFLHVIVIPIGVYLANRRLVLRNEDRHVSGAPLVGSVVGFLAVVVAPVGSFVGRLAWSWVPLATEVSVFALGTAHWFLSGLGAEAERQRHARRGMAPRRQD